MDVVILVGAALALTAIIILTEEYYRAAKDLEHARRGTAQIRQHYLDAVTNNAAQADAMNFQAGRQLAFTTKVLDTLQLLEKVVYLSEGASVEKKYILEILIKFAGSLEKEEHAEAEGSSVFRYGNNGLGPYSEQALVDWARGVEERLDPQPSGDPSLGREQ